MASDRKFSSAERETLLTRFAPTVVFHKDEKYFPINGFKTFNDNVVTDQNLNLTKIDLGDHTAGAQCFVSGDGTVYLQYFFSFTFSAAQQFVLRKRNGKQRTFEFQHLGEHNGDLEFMTFQLSSDLSRVEYILPSAHGTITRTNEFNTTSSGNPILYCALGTHAMYLKPGIQIINDSQFDSIFKYLIPIVFLGRYVSCNLCDVCADPIEGTLHSYTWTAQSGIQDFTPLRFCQETRELTRFETETFYFGQPMDNTGLVAPKVPGGMILYLIALFARMVGLLKNYASVTQQAPIGFINRREWLDPSALYP